MYDKTLAQGFLSCEDHAKMSLIVKGLFAPNLSLASAFRGPVAPSSFKHEALWGCLGEVADPSAKNPFFLIFFTTSGLPSRPFTQAYIQVPRFGRLTLTGRKIRRCSSQITGCQSFPTCSLLLSFCIYSQEPRGHCICDEEFSDDQIRGVGATIVDLRLRDFWTKQIESLSLCRTRG